MDHNHDTGGMSMPPPPPSSHSNMTDHRSMTSMHMTFFWGKNAEVLFSGWPGTQTGMYALALVFVFFLAFLIELIAYRQLFLSVGSVGAGVMRTLVHGLRVGLSCLLMLAIMSFNGGVFIMAVVGHTIGYLVFGSGILFKAPDHKWANVSSSHC